jgi:hypothetical protein
MVPATAKGGVVDGPGRGSETRASDNGTVFFMLA